MHFRRKPPIIFERISAPYKLSYYALVTWGATGTYRDAHSHGICHVLIGGALHLAK